MIRINIKCIFIAALLILTTGAVAQKIEVYQCKWNYGMSTGDEKELIDRLQIEEKSQFQFSFTNDQVNFYIDIVQADKAAVQKIMRFGLTTWINIDGKHKKSLGVRFPVAPEGNSDPGFKKDKGGDRKEMMLAMMERKNQEMVLVGFDGKGSEKSIDPRKDHSFCGKVEMLDSGRLHVYIAVPLKILGREDPSTFTYPLSIGFETGYLDLTRSGTASASGGQQSSGGGGHGGGGGMYGGNPGGGPPPSGGASGSTSTESGQQQPDLNELASPSKLWINRITLAEVPPFN
jgi:hypothetical protein